MSVNFTNLENNIEKINKINKALEEDILPKLKDAVANNYISNNIIYAYDDYEYLMDEMQEVREEIDLKEIYKENFDNYTKTLMDDLKIEQDKSVRIVDEINLLTEKIDIFIDKYYGGISDNLEYLREINDFDYDLEEHFYKIISNFFITNKIVPNDDIDSFVDLIRDTNDSLILDYINETNEILSDGEIDSNNETGIEVFEYNTPKSYDEIIPDLENLLENIKKNNNM